MNNIGISSIMTVGNDYSDILHTIHYMEDVAKATRERRRKAKVDRLLEELGL